MESGKDVKKKINVLEAMHYIMAAWQQVSQQTIQNCIHKAGHKYQSDGNEMANDDDDDDDGDDDDDDDDLGQDWEELSTAQKYDFQSYVSVDHHVATSDVETVEELCEAFGSARSVEEEDENEQEMVPSFAETYEALHKVKEFFYAHSGSDADRENVLSFEKSYFQLRQNSAKKQRTMNDFFC